MDVTSWSASLPILLAALVFGYLLGSIPFGFIITRSAGLGDVRKIGSGNIGATNVLRTGRKGLAALTLLLDALKGTAAVLLASSYGPDAAVAAGLGAFLGHLFPVWLGFKGGKGVATYLGILIALAWSAALVFAVAWLLVAFITRYSSLAALVAAICVPIALFVSGQLLPAQLFTLLSLLVFWKHRANIVRLLQGNESRIGARG
ncbi:glycerol-3-phosphate 1-O-acyltransferase PlsY [Chelativorans sp. J32]|uniref:glycerol-3-phosphate 1-O-acyltransferase PlsY n=1 Tax=Chelativorans sp. J32 TaxID=935840 RepID=UPI0004BCCB77|nr:glycerol-3-phosphate 1-O-acyltransferase PlsY [Chelativorans sp. J32]